MASATAATRPTEAVPQPSTPSASGPTAADAPQLPEPWDGLDTRILTDLARRGLMATLDTIKEAKTLMLDPSLAGPLGLVADVSSLKQHGVEKMFWLEQASSAFVSKLDTQSSQGSTKAALKSVNAPTKSVVYICRPEIRWMKAIAGKSLADSFSCPHHAKQWQLLLPSVWTQLAESSQYLKTLDMRSVYVHRTRRSS